MGYGFSIQSLGVRVKGFRCGVRGFGIMVEGLGSKV